LLFLAMLVLRLRIHARSPLPSTQPVLWLGVGFLEDVAIAGFAAALLLALGRMTRADDWTRVVFGAFALILLSSEVVWSQVLIFFGQPPSRDELLAGMSLTFARGSVLGPGLAGAALFILLFSLLLYVRARRSKNAGRGWSSPLRLLSVVAVAGAAAVSLPFSIHRRETARNPVIAQFSIWRPAWTSM
jgi:hypothetical protein